MRKSICLMSMIYFICTMNVLAEGYIENKLNEQDELLNAMELEMNNIRMTVSSLTEDNQNLIAYSQSLEEKIKKCNEMIERMQKSISDMKTALISNREDTSEVISILGDMSEELNKCKAYVSLLELHSKRANVFTQIAIPLASVPIIASGAILYCNGHTESGKVFMIGGSVILIGLEITWNCGKYVFKLW